MSKIPNEILKKLKNIAALMPLSKQEYNSTVVFLGKEIIDNKLETSLAIDPKKIYTKRKTHLRPVNHLTKIKKIWKREGENGVAKYVNQMIEFNTGLNEFQQNILYAKHKNHI